MLNSKDFGDIENSFYLVGLISSFDNSLQATADTVFKEISWKQSLFINCMVFFENPPTIIEVAQVVGCSHQNATKMLKRLENQGFIEFVRDQKDRRKQRIILTKKANAFKEKYNQISNELIKKIFAGVNSEEVKAAIKVISRLSENISNIGGNSNEENK